VDKAGDERHHDEHQGAEAVDFEAELQDRAAIGIAHAGGPNAQPIHMTLPHFFAGVGPPFFQLFELMLFRFYALIHLLLIFALGRRCLRTEFVQGLFVLADLRLKLALLRGEQDEADQAENEGESNGAGSDVSGSAATLFAAEEMEQGIASGRAAEGPQGTPHGRGQQNQHERQQRHQRGGNEIPARMFAEQFQQVHHAQPLSSSAVSTSTVM
jgi:hypothetical protein